MLTLRFLRRTRFRKTLGEGGFTLLGVIFALAFVVTVVSALGLLTARTIRAGRLSEERFIATALAREGIELVRGLRDENWFAHSQGATQIKWRGDDVGTLEEQRRAICNGTWIIDSQNPRLVASSDTNANRELFLSGPPNDAYVHGGVGTPTRFRRLVTISSTTGNCRDVVSAVQSPPPDPILVKVRVEWNEPAGGSARALEMHNELYDWIRQR